MIHPEAKLTDAVFNKGVITQVPTRDGFGAGLVEVDKKDACVVALRADVAESTHAAVQR